MFLFIDVGGMPRMAGHRLAVFPMGLVSLLSSDGVGSEQGEQAGWGSVCVILQVWVRVRCLGKMGILRGQRVAAQV